MWAPPSTTTESGASRRSRSAAISRWYCPPDRSSSPTMPASCSLPTIEKLWPAKGRKDTVLSATVPGTLLGSRPVSRDGSGGALGLLQRVLAKALPQVDRRIDWRGDREIEERGPPQLPRPNQALTGPAAHPSSVAEELLFPVNGLGRREGEDPPGGPATTR